MLNYSKDRARRRKIRYNEIIDILFAGAARKEPNVKLDINLTPILALQADAEGIIALLNIVGNAIGTVRASNHVALGTRLGEEGWCHRRATTDPALPGRQRCFSAVRQFKGSRGPAWVCPEPWPSARQRCCRAKSDWRRQQIHAGCPIRVHRQRHECYHGRGPLLPPEPIEMVKRALGCAARNPRY